MPRNTQQRADGEESKPARPLERYVQVLEMVASFPEEMTLIELATALGIPKTTVYRLLNGLIDSNLVTSSSRRTGGFRLAPRLLRMLHVGSTGFEIELVSQQHLQELADATGCTSYLAKLTGTKVRSIVMRAPSANFCIYVTPGSELCPHAAASGKAIMAFQSDEIIRAALKEPLQRFTQNTKTDIGAVLAEYEEIRETGVAKCFAEDVDGFGAVACPIRLPDVGVLYSVGLTGPLDVIFRRPLQPPIDRLKEAAAHLAIAIQSGERIAQVRDDAELKSVA